jgi:hypothetical protein
MSFIKSHLLKRIKGDIIRKQDSVNFNGTFYFDKPVIHNKKPINRINRECAYLEGNIMPILNNKLNAIALIDVFFKIKNDEFFFYKKVDGKEHRIRFKNGTKR